MQMQRLCCHQMVLSPMSNRTRPSPATLKSSCASTDVGLIAGTIELATEVRCDDRTHQDLIGMFTEPTHCDAPGFQSGSLTLMNRPTELTLFKRRSTWAITSKTSPMTPNDPFWLTLVNPWSNPTQNPLEHPFALPCQPELLPHSPNFT
jgi:hypothetical protein